ncbi:MAG TPA: helix-turn-helix domain-containing protein [Candidatus Paenibacillus intestinavium]|nr:helix-turn-helix domain-containing protein [Candidatus Paenibacillus intestinavium]
MATLHSIGDNIRVLRIKNDMSQEQLALQCKMNPSYLGQIERGIKNPTLRTLTKISSGLEVTIDQLIRGHVVDTLETKAIFTTLTPNELKQLMVEAIQESNILSKKDKN